MAESQDTPPELSHKAASPETGEVTIPHQDAASSSGQPTPGAGASLIPAEETPPSAPYAEEGATMPAVASGVQSVAWTASEFIAHEKSPSWYVALGVSGLVAAGLIFLLTKDAVTSGVILFVAFVLGFYGSRQPRQLTYQVDAQGIQIERKRYSYQDFRSFAIMPEGAFSSLVFVPLKRFAPLITLYYAPEDEEKIINIVAAYLPHEERQFDLVDRFMRRIRF